MSAPVAAASPAPPPQRSFARKLLTWTLAAAALAFVVYAVPLRDRCDASGCVPGLGSTLARANLPVLVALFALHLLSNLAWAARWRALLGLAHAKLRLIEVFRVTLEAQAGAVLLPAGIGGDALRVAYSRERAPGAPLPKLLASIVADRVLGLVTLASLAALVALVSSGGHWERVRAAGPLLPFVIAFPIGAACGWLVLRSAPLRRLAGTTGDSAVGRFAKPFLEYATDRDGPNALARGLGFSLLVSATQLFIIRGLVLALGGSPSGEGAFFVGATFAAIAAAMPGLPGGWGTADAGYVFFLGQAGVPASIAAAICLLYRAFWYTTCLVGAASALARRPR